MGAKRKNAKQHLNNHSNVVSINTFQKKHDSCHLIPGDLGKHFTGGEPEHFAQHTHGVPHRN